MNKYIKKKERSTPNYLSIYLIWAIILCNSLTLFFLYKTHGEIFSEIFFNDSLDTGMDFFHSIEYTRGRAPYDLFETLYPPLANLFFYII